MSGKSDILVLGTDPGINVRPAEFKPARPVMKIWKFFTSVKLSVYLLLSLAATSIIGTVIPQNETPEKYLRAFGGFLYRIFDILDFFDMYHSAWFQFLLLMLTANIIVCSIDRLSSTWKIIFVKSPSFNVSRFRSAAGKEAFSINQKPELLKKPYEAVFSRHFSCCSLKETEKGFCIFAEKWRWTRLGVYVVHASVVLLLIGGLIGSIFGFDGYVNIPEGESVSAVGLRGSENLRDLGFTIRCDDFNVSFYKSGAPKEYRSSLSIIEAGKTVLQKNIIVNDPLRYNGINFFQSGYGPLSPKAVGLTFVSSETGMQYRKEARLGGPIEVPEDKGTLVIKGFRKQAEYKGHQMGETFLATLTPKDGNPVFLFLPVQFPDFDRMRKDTMAISVTGYQNLFYTGLQVTNDPGVRLVYSGFVLMILGCFITFFMSHQRFCVEVERQGEGSRVLLAAVSNKNKLGMQRKVEKFAQRLAALADTPIDRKQKE